ncbi:SpoIIE family protein phosphatase [Streptacidiphilus jiangxiensis]|uniref:GAF domain-containing protein n=1 Tax=Streptacidiphilus jiangxiensis TaxID=235985 RepID=A0A1H7YVK3_STRJI|nr:SpoIIE family protein phosphatase [Streptacidiphilus jiangxiensis]SEM50262.1 GAF domain-containing protein [Streptacidiphilus jiangxiensis]
MTEPAESATGQDMLAGMFAHAPVIFAALGGPDHRLEGANAAFYEAVGVGRGPAMLGRPAAEVLPELVHQGLVDLLDAAYREGEPFVAHHTGVLLGPAGKARQRFFDFSFEPRRDRTGRIVGVAFLAVDVTRQRAAHKLASEQQALLEQIARDSPLAEVLDGMCRAIEKLSPRVLSSVLLLDETGRRLRHGAAPSLPDFYNAAVDGSPIGPSEGSCGTAAYRREMVVVSDIATDPLWAAYRDLAQRAGLAACWSSPILSSSDELLGTFAMYHRTPQELSEDDLDLSIVFTRTAALAIERHHAERARRQALERELALSADLAFVLETSTAVSEEAHFPDNLRRLARLAVPALGPACVIDVVDDGRIRRVAVALAPDLPQRAEALLAAETSARAEDSPVRRVLATGASEVSTAAPAGAWQELGLRITGQVCVPLTARGHTFGALTLVATEDRMLDARAISLAEELARTAAAGAETTRQHEQRARLAHDLQAGLLLAALPEMPGAQLAASYRPAGEGLDIGGDFYDVFALPGDWWGLVIGDVCGRGAHAATTTALVRHTARAVAPLLPTPSAVAESVNEALLARPDSGESFVTLIYAELRQVRDGLAVSMVRAGHPPPLLLRADGTVTSPSPAGQLLGVSPDPELELESFTLAGGDCLVLVTDGILEARDPTGTLFGEERLVAALRSATGTTDAQRILDAVTDAVDAFTGGVTDDDQAVLVLVSRQDPSGA